MKVTTKVIPEGSPALALLMQEQEKKHPANVAAEKILRSFFAAFAQHGSGDNAIIKDRDVKIEGTVQRGGMRGDGI